jgi:hypothetical protein
VFVTGELVGTGVNSTPVGVALGDNVGGGVGGGVGLDVVGGGVGLEAQLGSPTHSKSSHVQSAHVLRYVPSEHSGLPSIRIRRLRNGVAEAEQPQSESVKHCMAPLLEQYPMPS